jgi:hypothetical protein
MFKEEQDSDKLHLVLFWDWLETMYDKIAWDLHNFLAHFAIFEIVSPSIVVHYGTVVQ